MEIRPVELVGQRAHIVPMEEGHAEALFEAGKDPSIWTYMPVAAAQSLEDMQRVIDTALSARRAGSEFPFVILDRDSSQVVGSTRFLDISLPNRSLEIGWTWLTPSVWRTRINTECKYMLLKHCFETLGTVRVQIKTDNRNLRSQQAIERIGGVKEGILRRHRVLHDGYIRDTVYYSVIDDEWPSLRNRLEAMLQR